METNSPVCARAEDVQGIPQPITREDILALERGLENVPGALKGDSDFMPLKHSFAPGVYVREIFIPKGSVLTGKIHRHAHPNFLMKGEVIVVTEHKGREHLVAPVSMISQPGTKRAIMALEDTIWVTVHVTTETDLKKIEDYVIAPSYGDLQGPTLTQLSSEVAQKNCLILALKELGRDFHPLLQLPAEGTLLPFRRAIEELRVWGISLDGLFATKQEDGIWHVSTNGVIPLAQVKNLISDFALVGTWVAVAIGGSAVVTGAASYFGSKKNASDVSQVPLETPEQAAARQGLLGFAQGGTYGNYTAGTPYSGSLGDFGLSSLEQAGLSKVTANQNAGQGKLFDLGSSTLQDLLGTDKYNPLNNSGVVNGLTGAIDYNTKQAETAAKRSAGYAGNLYSTDAVRSLGNVQAQGANAKAATLAGLYQNYIGEKLGAVPQAFAAQAQGNAADEQKLQDMFAYGQIPRSLNNAKDQADYAEFQRQRQEKQGQISALGAVAGSNSNFGVPSVSLPANNPWLDVANLLAQFGGKYAGQQAGNSGGGGSGYIGGGGNPNYGPGPV